MNESAKTLSFVIAAALALGAAWLGRPQPVGVDLPDLVGQPLFPNFKDAYDAKSMKIVEYDEDLGELRNFEVAQKNGLWVIPSHQDYPADAEETLAEAANLLVNLNVINVQSQEKKEHETYGVIRPALETLEAGDKGVGKLVTLKNAQGDRLAEVVIGEPVAGQPNQRYVRAADQEPVYIVELDPAKLSTSFEDWVERDILDLNGFDIQDIAIYDYSANPQLSNRGIILNDQDRLKVTARFNADEAQWELDQFEEFIGGEMRPSQLLETEELDKESLDAMKQALDDLQIVDVERKPEGLGAEIVDDNFWKNNEGITSLFERGFYAAQDTAGKLKLRSSDGEVKIRTKDGVEYLLRFGQVAGVDSGSTSTADESAEEDEGSLNRFVMVSAALYEDAFEKPVLELPAGDVAKDDDSEVDDSEVDDGDVDDSEEDMAEDGPAEDDPAEDADSDGEAGEEAVDVGEDSEPNGDADAGAAEDNSTEDDSEQPSAEQDNAAADDATENNATEDDAQNETTTDEVDLDAERAAKLKEYERQMDDYKAKLDTAKEKVDKLNFRFADWYYVVSENEYRKIHLVRSDIVRGKESTANEGSDIDAFRMLEETELEGARSESN